VQSRKFSPDTDGGFCRARAFTEVMEDDALLGTFFPVPQGIVPGMHIVVDLPDGKQIVVQIPEGVFPGDVLQVTVQDASLQLVKNMGTASAYLKPLRVMLFAAGVCPVVLLLLAIITPYWLYIPGSHVMDCVGLGGRRLNGYIEDWNQIEAWCTTDARMLAMPERCAVYRRLASAGRLTFVCLASSAVAYFWSLLGLFFRREFSAVVGVLSTLVLELAAITFYLSVASRATAQIFGHAVVWGLSAWIGIAGVGIGFAVWFAILVAYLDSRLERNLLGVDLQDIQAVLHKGCGADAAYEWDENDPGAGCPVVWRTYGLTPSGLYHDYRQHWWGWPYASFLYLLTVPIHFVKTFDWNGIRRVYYGPPSEEQPLRERGVTSTVVINYMLYRRSNIIMCVVFVLPLIRMTLNALSGQEREMLNHVQEADQTNTFADFQQQNLNATFVDYSLHVLQKGFGSIGIWSDNLWVWRHIVRLLFLVLALIFSFTSMLRWDDFKLSRYLLVFAWLAMLIAPFAAALIPSRSFVDWGLFDNIVREHVREARSHYQVDGLLAACLWNEPLSILTNLNYYAETACDVVNQKVPYVMPPTIDFPTPLGTFPIPVTAIPWVGERLPVAGTDLKALHSTCRRVRSIGNHELTLNATDAIVRGCQLAATYLYENTPDGQRNDFKDYKDRLSQSLEVDPSHLQGSHAMRFWHGTGAVLVQETIGLHLVSHSKELTGRLIRRSENPDGCGSYDDDGPTCEDKVIFLGPLPRRPECSLNEMVERASSAGAKGLVIYGAQDRSDTREVPDWLRSYDGALPVGFISSRVDGETLLQELRGGTPSGLAVTVELARPEWKKEHSRTSHGCRCKGRGLDSECKVRDPGLFTEERKTGKEEPFPWCETVDTCRVAYDVCVPSDAASAVQVPSKACLPNFPCRRQHAGIHEKTRKLYTWKAYSRHEQCATAYTASSRLSDTITWMDCVAPLGFSGVATKAGGRQESLEGTQVSFVPGMSAVSLRGQLIVSTGCLYRLRVEDSDGSFVQLKLGDVSARNGEILFTSGEGEEDVEIDVDSVKADKGVGAVVFEQQCESIGDDWVPVPLDKLRYVPSASDAQSSLLQRGRAVSLDNQSHAGLGAHDHGSSRKANILTHSLGSELAASQGTRRMEAPPGDGGGLLGWNSGSSTGNDDAGGSRPEMLWTCEAFVGTRCNSNRRCGENEVCDSVGREDRHHPPGYCHCSPNYCWSAEKNGCVAQHLHAREVVSHLLNESMYEEQVVKAMDTAKVAVSLVISLQEGIANLNAIIGHVLAIGPGMLISAWTAKLIFAHSAIPAYFCYFFPWIYSPMAWALYNVYYQLIPDWRLFTGLLILAGWPMIMTGLTMMYGLHRQMEIPRLMHVVNNLLLYYYMILFLGYGLLIWFAIGYKPEGNDWINERLRGEWSAPNWIRYYIGLKQADKDVNFINLWLVDSFATFFLTCNAVTDAFVVVISQEHNEAWLMHHQALESHKSEVDAAPAVAKAPTLRETMEEYSVRELRRSQGQRFAVEEEVIKDWLLLINDVKVQVPKSGRRRHDTEEEADSEDADPVPEADLL